MDIHQIAALSTFFNKKYYSTWTHQVSKCSYQIDHVFTFRKDLRHFSDTGSVSGQLIDLDHRAVKATLRSFVPPKKKKTLKNDRQRLMRLDYAILQSEEGRDELARRALEILKYKSYDKTSYEAIADALHLATEEVLPKRARAEPLWFSQNVLALQGLINLRNNAFDAYHITRSSHAVLHCKVLAEHYNVLLEKPNPTGFLSSWVVSMTGSVEPRAPKLHGLLSRP